MNLKMWEQFEWGTAAQDGRLREIINTELAFQTKTPKLVMAIGISKSIGLYAFDFFCQNEHALGTVLAFLRNLDDERACEAPNYFGPGQMRCEVKMREIQWFLKELVSLDEQLSELLEALFSYCKLMPTLDDLLKLKVQDAVTKALSFGIKDSTVHWDLLQHYLKQSEDKRSEETKSEEKSSDTDMLEYIYELATNISKKNPNYSQAQEICFNIVSVNYQENLKQLLTEHATNALKGPLQAQAFLSKLLVDQMAEIQAQKAKIQKLEEEVKTQQSKCTEITSASSSTFWQKPDESAKPKRQEGKVKIMDVGSIVKDVNCCCIS